MSGLIDADTLKVSITKYGALHISHKKLPIVKNEAKELIRDICFAIDAQPKIDAIPVVHGHWIYKWNPYFKQELPYCSVCEKASPSVSKTDYCPHCGAKMDVLDTNVGNKEKVTE